MAYDEHLADRIRHFFQEKSVLTLEKKMFGGLCYMVNDKMCVGIVKEELMARVGADNYEECLAREHCIEMNFTGRAMKGYVLVQPHGIDSKEDLYYYLEKSLAYNPLAKRSKKK